MNLSHSQRPTPWRAAAVLSLIAAAAPATLPAQDTDLRLPILVDADSMDYDGRNSMLTYHGLRLTQGNIGVQADEGRASTPDFEDSIWQFSGNVVIDVEAGHIESDSADLKFSGHELQLATISGSPATFEMKRPGSAAATYAEARRVRYDFHAGTIEFSEKAIIIEGCNQISSDYLVYNIAEQRINAQSTGNGEQKVKITYTPRDSVNGGDCGSGVTGDASGSAPRSDENQ